MMRKLAKKTAAGTIWASITLVLEKILLLITSIILARLLSPADFGLIGLAMVAINYLTFVKDTGIGRALIHKQDRTDETASTAFWISISTGFLTFVLILLASPLIAAFFDTPEVQPLAQLLAVSVLVNSIGNIHDVLLQKELEFKRKLVPDVARTLFRGIVSIVLAWLGWGVWSLALGHIIGSLSSTISVWLVLSWRPSLFFSVKIAKELLRYGSQILLSSFLFLLGGQADFLLIGILLGEVALGFYTIAFKIPQLIILSVASIINRSIFPAYAKLQNDQQTLQQGLLMTIRLISLIIFPVSIGLFVVAPDLIDIVYTNKWAPAIPVLRILALYASVRAIVWNLGSVYKAIGRPDVVTKTTLLKTILLFPALWWGINEYGIFGAALAQLISSSIVSFTNFFIAHQVLGIKLSTLLSTMRSALLGSVILFLSTGFFLQFATPMSSLVRLVVVSTLGASVYVMTVLIAERETILFVRKLIRPASSLSG